MSLYRELKTAIKEEDVNRIYKNFFSDGAQLNTSKIKVDGLITIEDFLVLLEFKYDKDFTKRSNVIEVIIQVLYYLKQFENQGKELPSICFVGDINECFYFHSNILINYLSLDIDWSIAPSNAGRINTELFKILYDDEKINLYVHELNEGFKLEILLKELKNLNDNTVQKRRITKKI